MDGAAEASRDGFTAFPGGIHRNADRYAAPTHCNQLFSG
jgi:hypothetical protein